MSIQDTISLLPCAFSLSLLAFQRLHVDKSSQFATTGNTVYTKTRLLGCILIQLLTLAIFFTPSGTDDWPFLLVDIYCTSLAWIANLRVTLQSIVSLHLTVVLFCNLAVYTYRDIWPLFTFDQVPVDAAAGAAVWFKIILLTCMGVVLPLAFPRDYVPVDPEHPMDSPSIEQTASWFARLTYTYMDGIIRLANKQGTLHVEDLPPLVDSDRASLLTPVSRPELDPMLSKRRRHLFWSLLRVFRTRVVWLIGLQIVVILTGFIGPIALKQLLDYLQEPAQATVRPLFWVLCLFLGPVARTLVNESYMSIATRNVLHIDVILTDILLRHALRIRLSTESDDLIGKINNLAAVDVSNISWNSEYWIVALFFPLQLLLSTVFLYIILGWSALVGLAVMILASPLPGYFSSALQAIEAQKMKKTDARVQTVVETVTILRMIKLLGWERKMQEVIETKREEELLLMRKSKLLTILGTNINLLVPLVTMLTTFAVYALVQKQELTASAVFASLAVFEAIRIQFQQILGAMTSLVNAKVSLDRVGAFLDQAEVLDNSMAPPTSGSEIVGFRDASFAWVHGSTRNFSLNIPGDLFFPPGVSLIMGQTSAGGVIVIVICLFFNHLLSGKTSLLLALLGEMQYTPLTDQSFFNLPRLGGVAYAVQESWIQNETVKNNILFGSPFDAIRYQKVLYQCALLPDLELLPAGDETEIGEKGVTLSGGQKARVTLARAVYSKAQIVLLDDPLAALDVRAANWVTERCLAGDLLEGRTVLMATHNASLGKKVARYIVSIGIDGKITHGPPSAIMPDSNAISIPNLTDADVVQRQNTLLGSAKTAVGPSGNNGQIMKEEVLEQGAVKSSAWRLYFDNLATYPLLLWSAWIVCMILKEGALSIQAWLLGLWSEEYGRRPANEVPIVHYLLGYSVLLLCSMLLYAIGFSIFILGQLRVGRRIHKLLVDSVLGATFRWLDVTPVSHIIARATFDMKAVDDSVSTTLGNVVNLASILLIKFLSIVVVTPTFVVPGVLFTVASLSLCRLCMATHLPAKRIVSQLKSPILAHFSATITGLASVRAYGVQNENLNELFRRLDGCTAASVTFWSLNRWITIRTQTVGGAFTACLAAYLVYGVGTSSPADSGFSLTMSVIFTSIILSFVGNIYAFEMNGNSLERLLQYLNIEQEAKSAPQGDPPAYWPASGEIRFVNVSARYALDGTDVLHDISLTIDSGERVAIVGHTGCGKSSLILALLRCIPTKGEVYFDGLPTSTMNLQSLRGSVSIIPQVPDLLAGTLRDNLDPFLEYDDALLTSSLRAAGLYALQTEDPEMALSLDSKIISGGSNISVGQRQIIALARALLRGSKVLILDEATSSIDHATDAIIQHSLRSELRNCTIIAIAHRLSTIIDFDKILVLEKGRVMEFDTPLNLLNKPGGYLRALVDESSDREKLLDMAGSG